MIIKAISDTHNMHHMLNDLECDVLVHCGDFSTKGNYTETVAFLYWFIKQPAKYKILVPGNHDRRIKTHPELIKLCHDMGIRLLMNEGIEIGSVKFWGGVFVPRVKDSGIENSLNERIKAWRNMPSDIDVLLTHAPPQYILDTSVEGRHCGCDQLMARVQQIKPKYHIFGHVHEKGGSVITFGDTMFVNAACMNREYLMVRNAIKIELDLDRNMFLKKETK